MEDVKELTIEMLEDVNEKYDELEEITIDVPSKNGNIKTKLFINKFFHPSKVRECIKELIVQMQEIKKYKNEEESYENIYQGFLMLLIIKHFSSLEIPSEFTRQLAVLERLVSTEILAQIFSKFEKEEIEKVAYELNFIVGKLNLRIDLAEKIKESEELKNQELKE